MCRKAEDLFHLSHCVKCLFLSLTPSLGLGSGSTETAVGLCIHRRATINGPRAIHLFLSLLRGLYISAQLGGSQGYAGSILNPHRSLLLLRYYGILFFLFEMQEMMREILACKCYMALKRTKLCPLSQLVILAGSSGREKMQGPFIFIVEP